MRSILLFACLCMYGWVHGQGSGFSFTYTGPNQINVGPSCMAALNWGHPNTPTASSNLPGGVIVSFGIYSISGGYHIGDQIHGGTTVTVFYQAVDNFGNNALFGFTINFIDLLPPVFDPLSLPHNITVNCSSNLPPPAAVEATDNCSDVDPPLTITYSQNGTVAPCAGGIITRTWVADDDLGNQATFVQSITVTADVTPPVIVNNLVNGMAPCSTAMAQYTTWLNTQRANFMATDAGCGVMTLSDNALPPSNVTSFCGVIPVVFTAKDNCNNISTVMKTFTVTNATPPVIINPASGASGNCGQANIAQVFNTWISNHGGATASDDCSSVTWTTFPAHPSVADTCDAAIQVMFIAGDGCNNFDTTSASFVLIDDTAPTVTTVPTSLVLGCSTLAIDSLLMDWLVTGGHSAALDLCTPDNQLQLGYKIGTTELTLQEVLDAWQDSLVSGCHDGIIVNGIGINNVKAYLQVRFTYDDNCDNEGGAVAFFGITDNGRPVFDTLPSNLSYICSGGQNWMQVLEQWYNSAGDADYSDLCSDVVVHPNITFDSAVVYLTAALDTACAAGAFVTVQFGLQDDCGNTSLTTPSATFTLQDTLPPGFTHLPEDLVADCAQNAQLQLQNWLDTLAGATAIDGCGDLTWMFSWIDTAMMVQSGVPLIGPYPQVGDLGCNEAVNIVFTVTDACQNASSDLATFTVIDTTGPVLVILQDTVFLSCADTIPGDFPVVNDVCDPNPAITFQDVVSADTCLGHPGMVLRTWMAVDACGNSTIAQVLYLSADTIAPTFDLPSDTVAFCSIDTLVLLNVADNCDPSPEVTWSDELTGNTCHQVLNRTWSVIDACGNVATALQQFDLSDEGDPVIEYSPGNVIYGCDPSFENLQAAYEHWLDSVVVSDGCSASSYFIALTGSYVLEDTSTWPGTPLPDSIMIMCGETMTVVGDLVAYDECGNVLVEEISFVVQDTVAPMLLDCPASIVVAPDSSCTGLVSFDVPTYSEICFPDNVKLAYVLDGGDTTLIDTITHMDTILPVGVHLLVWIATDCNGNSGQCQTFLEVIDESALTIICPDNEIAFPDSSSCSVDLYVHTPETIIAGCGLGAIWWRGYVVGEAQPDTFTFPSAADSILVSFSGGIHDVFLIVADLSGDIDTCKYRVEIRDTFPPEIICKSDTLFLPPSGLNPSEVAGTAILNAAVDGCGIDTILYDPAFVDCSMNGQHINVTITVTDLQGNTSTCEADLFVVTPQLLPTWERGLCDDTLRLFSNVTIDTAAHYTFSWTGPNGYISSEENPVIPESDSTDSGTYTLVVQSGSGCTSTESIEVLIMELVSPVITAEDDTVCAGDVITLNSQVFSGDIQYQWYLADDNGDVLLDVTPDPVFNYTTTLPGILSFYAIILSDSCSSVAGPSIDVLVAPIPVAEISSIPAILCITDSLYLSPAQVIDSLQYLWTGPGGFISNDPTPPAIAASEIDSFAIYSLTVSSNLCSSEPDSVQVNVQLPPVTPSISGDAQACEGGTITILTMGGADQYDWIDPALIVTTTTDSFLTINAVSMSQSGNWFVIAYNNGCPSDTSEAFVVSVDTAISVEILTTPVVCEGDSITLSISPMSQGMFTWSGPGGFSDSTESPTTLAMNGTYHVAVTTLTGCDAMADITITVDALPVIDTLITDAESCVDGSGSVTIYAITLPASNASFEYHWEGSSPFTVQDSSIIFQNATAAINGVYTLFIINGACTSTKDSIEISVTNAPADPVVSGDNVYCSGDTIILSIENPIPGAMYSWMSNDTSLIIPSPGTLILPNATINQTGLYEVSVEINGCQSGTTNYGVQVRPALVAPVITGPSMVCEGGSVVLEANIPAGAIIHWTGPNGFESTDASINLSPATPDQAGAYVVTYEINGCEAPPSLPFNISIQSALPTPLITSDLNSVCLDNILPVTFCLDPTSLIDGAQYTWLHNGIPITGVSNTDSCIVLTGAPLQAGDNFITVITSLQNCVSDTSDLVVVEGDEFPEMTADAGPSGFYCPGEPILLQGSTPNPGVGAWTTNDPLVIFAMENNPHTQVFPLPSGSYTFYWTLTYRTCVNYSSDSVVITVITPPIAYPDTVQVPFGQTHEFVITLNDSLSNQPYTLSIVMNPSKGNALHAGNGIIRYTPNLGYVGPDVMTYKVCSTDCPDECSETTVFIQVGSDSDCFIPTFFTPNEDGINDELLIPCLETSRYPDNRIIIFNEWGDAVFTASPYENNWDGTVSGESLPVGTYFYIMDFGDGSTPKRSFLVLER